MENKLTVILSPKRLRFYRRQLGLRQYQIADVLGVERTTYVGYEKLAEIEVSLEKAEQLALMLNVKLSQIEKSEKSDENVEHSSREVDKEYINIHREVWQELKMNNETYRVSLDKLIAAVDRTMDNLSKPRNAHN